jgi:leucyl/phenylalanyl-tRNA--protein transferase
MTTIAARLTASGARLGTEFGLDPCPWDLPVPTSGDNDDLIAVGGDLAPSTLVTAYSRGLFPMPVGRRLGWFSPLERGIIPLDGLHVSRSLRRSQGRYDVRWNGRFRDVVTACSDPRRPQGWITPKIVDAYDDLHRRGLAHSVEVHDDTGRLVGGLYGVCMGGLFAGESMFHHSTDASKVALVELVERLRTRGHSLLDVQWATPHLRSLGAAVVDRGRYLELLADALERRPPSPADRGP